MHEGRIDKEIDDAWGFHFRCDGRDQRQLKGRYEAPGDYLTRGGYVSALLMLLENAVNAFDVRKGSSHRPTSWRAIALT